MKLKKYTLKFTGSLMILLALVFAAGTVIDGDLWLLLESLIYLVLGTGLILHKPWARAGAIVFTTLVVIANAGDPDLIYVMLLAGPFMLLLLNPWAGQLAPLINRKAPPQPLAFALAKEQGIWKYRFILAGFFFILLAFDGVVLALLPESVLNHLNLPNVRAFLAMEQVQFDGLNYGAAVLLKNSFWVLTGIWLLWRPISARPVALAMALTFFYKPLFLYTLLGDFPGLPVFTATSMLSYAIILVLLWPKPKPLARLSGLQIIAIALIILFVASVPGFFIHHRYEASRDEGEPFWGPTVVEVELPPPANYREYEMFGTLFRLPWAKDAQIFAFDLRHGRCSLIVETGKVAILDFPSLDHQALSELSWLGYSPLEAEQTALTSPGVLWTVMRVSGPSANQVYKFHSATSTGFLVPSTFLPTIKLYDQTGTTSIGLMMSGISGELTLDDLLTMASSLRFTEPKPASAYYEAGHAFSAQGDNTGAQLAFANACWLDPDNPEYLYSLAEIISRNVLDSERTGRTMFWSTAKTLLNDALVIQPDFSKAADLLAEIEALEAQHQD